MDGGGDQNPSPPTTAISQVADDRIVPSSNGDFVGNLLDFFCEEKIQSGMFWTKILPVLSMVSGS